MVTTQTDNTPVPASADVVIIGGGIVGCAAAYRLAKRGVSVTLCEKGRIAGEQSSRNWGWVRQQGRDPRELPLMMQSLQIWQSFQNELGEDVGFRQTGSSYLARDQKELDFLAGWLDTAHQFNLDTQILDTSDLKQTLPGLSHKWHGALFTASDGRAEPARAVPAIAAAAQREGATISTRCALRGIETKAGRVNNVVTEKGSIQTGTIICAAGAWTSMFCRNLGIDVPQLQVKGTVARTAPAPNILDGEAWAAPVAIRRRLDDGYTIAHGSALEHFLMPNTLRYFRKFLPSFIENHRDIRLRVNGSFLDNMFTPNNWDLDETSPFEKIRVLDPEPSTKILAELQANIAKYHPELADVPLLESWAGMIEASPDAVPILSETSALSGFYIATGLSGHGFGLGPAAGYAIADLATGQTPIEDLTPFRLSRFFDGSKIQLGPGV